MWRYGFFFGFYGLAIVGREHIPEVFHDNHGSCYSPDLHLVRENPFTAISGKRCLAGRLQNQAYKYSMHRD